MTTKLKWLLDSLKEPVVLAVILSTIFYIFIARHNAAIAFTVPTDPSIYKLSVLLKISFWVIFTIATYGIIIFINKLRVRDVFFKRWFLYSSAYFVVLLIVLLLIYPGHWVWDEFHILEAVKTFTPYAWQNYFTNIYYTFCLLIFPSAISIVLIQIGLIALIVGYIATITRSLVKNRYAPYILMLVFLLPPILINNFYPLRITLYSYVEILLFAYLLYSFVKNKLRLSSKEMIFISFLVGILAFWRTEGVYYLALIPLLLVYSGLVNKNNWLDFKTHALLTPSYVVLAVLALVTYISNDSRYAITTMINPLSVMVQEPLRGSKIEEKLSDMNKAIDLDVLRRYPSYTEIPSYWNGLLRPEYSGNMKDFRSAYIYIVAHNPDYFLEARSKTFLASSGLAKEYPPVIPVGLLGRDDQLSGQEKLVAERFETTNKFTRPINPTLKQSITTFLLGIDKGGKLTATGHVFWNLMVPMLLLLGVLIHALIKHRTFWAIACIFILLRVPIIFITAPASYFMYYLPVYISGFTVTALYLLLYCRKLRIKKATKHVRT